MTSLPVTRRDQLLDVLRREGTVRVSDIASALGVTPVTVRRDITQLANEGLVRRVHGGATLLAPPGGDEETPAVATLGMVVPSLDYYYPGVLQGAREAAARLGVRLVLRGSSYQVEDDERQVTGLVETVGVDGLLIAPNLSGPGGDALLARLAGLDVPVVLLERTATIPPHGAPMESVVSDHALGASIAVHHLASLGHRRIGLAYSQASPTAPKVRTGWLSACEELGLDAAPDLSMVNYRDPHLARRRSDRILDACLAAGTTALLVHSDPEAISLVERCEERGIRVPGQLSVVAYDDEVAGMANPPLTAVRPPRRSIGRTAVELLVGPAGRARSGGAPRDGHARADDPGVDRSPVVTDEGAVDRPSGERLLGLARQVVLVVARRPQPGRHDRADRDERGDDGDRQPDRLVGVVAHRDGHDGRRDEQRHEVHDLDQRVDRRAGGVLERVADGVADDRRRVGVGPLAAEVAVLDDLLRVVPGTARVGQEDRHEHAGRDGPAEEPGERADAEAEPDGDRRERREQTGRGQLPQGVAGADVDDLAVLRPHLVRS